MTKPNGQNDRSFFRNFILDFKRQEGKEREGKDSIFTCETIDQ